MRMKKLWLFVTFLAVACGTWAVLFRTNLMPKQKETVSKFIQDIIPGRRKGFIRGIVSSEESFTALIDNETVREGDTIHGVKIVKIYVDIVEFEKNGRQWTQELNETPSRQWYVDTEIRARAEAEVKAKMEAEAKVKAEEEARVFAEVRAKEEADAKAQAEAEAKAKAEEQSRTLAEARAKEEADAKAQAEATSTTEAVTIDEAPQNKMDIMVRPLGDEKPSDQNNADEALEQTGDPAVPSLIKALKDKDWIVRQSSAETLGLTSDPRAVEPLITALNDSNMWVRLRSVVALGQLGDRRAVEPINRILTTDEDELVRRHAAKALGILCDDRSVGPLIEVLSDKNRIVRRNASEALGLIGNEQAIEALEKTLEDENPDVRAVAANALGSIRSNATIEELATASNGKQAISIIEALIDLKIYVGAGIGALLLLVGLTIALFRRPGFLK
jgi:HEAT repeat protein